MTDDRDRPDDATDPASPRPDGKVYCCASLGWVTPDVAFDHRWETSRPLDEYIADRAWAWDGVEPGV
jgi:hypothetical protein